MADQTLFGTTTQVVKMPGATFTIKGAPEGSVSDTYDEPEVETGIQEEGEEPDEIAGPDGEFAPLD